MIPNLPCCSRCGSEEFRSIWFNGGAFICTNEGKTVQRLHRAGFTVSAPTDNAEVIGPDYIAAELAVA
jgi:hypothetical protein